MTEARYKDMWTFLIESNYEDAADIDSDMRCIICTRILINAHNSVCGCRYCLECVNAYLNGETRFCPGNTDECKMEELDIDSNIYPDHAMNYRISKLNVACRYSCGYRCELRNMEEHERACQRQPNESSDSILVNDQINVNVLRKRHLDDTVELQSKMPEKRLATEIDEASLFQIKEKMSNLKNDNERTKEKIWLLERNLNIKYGIKFFLCLLIICGGAAQYLRSTSDTNQQLMELRSTMEVHVRQIDVLAEKYGKIEREAQIKNAELQRNIDGVHEKQKTGLGDVEKRVRQIEINNDMQNQTEFVWPVDDWTAKTKSARQGWVVDQFSETFYSHQNGYKMCLSLSPNGNGGGKGSHLSVFFHLMRGPFDNILSWPFRRTVTLSLIDQSTGVDHVSVIVKPEWFPNNTHLNKPSTDRNEGFGKIKMIELTELSTNPKLFQDDRIFIRCVVK